MLTTAGAAVTLLAVLLAGAAHPPEPAVRIAGRITYSGPDAPGEPIDMGNDPYCRQVNSGRTVMLRRVEAGSGGGLANVIVHVREGVPAGATMPDPAPTPPVLNQQNCAYAPHVLTVRAGGEFVIRNSDRTLHNVHARPQLQRGFNVGQPLPGIEARRTFDVPEIVPVSCDIHGWMHSVIAVFDHPFFAISGPDGSFELPELPPGEYLIEAWHETLGTQTRTVTVAGGGSVDLDFDFGG